MLCNVVLSPGARRLLRWEQRLKLHASSGQVVMPEELKVKMSVSAAELQQETGLSQQGLQYLLAVAGDRSVGVLWGWQGRVAREGSEPGGVG